MNAAFLFIKIDNYISRIVDLIYSSIYSAPASVHCWLAAGSLQGLTVEKCKALQGKQVLLFPDADAFPKWEERMKQLRKSLPNIRFGMARCTDGIVPTDEMPNGLDIVDWLMGVR